MNKKSLLVAAGFALATTLATPVFATDNILFDPDGTNDPNGTGSLGADLIGAFDWAVASSLIDEGIPISTVPADINVYTHAALQGYSDPGGNPTGSPTGLNDNYEITFVSAITETVTSITDIATTAAACSGGGANQSCTVSATIDLELSPSLNDLDTIEIYYDDFTSGGVQSSALDGTGYADGTLILSAKVVELKGTFKTDITFTDVDGDGLYTPGTDIVTSTILLDNFNDDEWSGQLTLAGQGGTDLGALVGFQDPNFFITELDMLVAALFFNTSNIIPFNQTNPSNSFDDLNGGTINTGDGSLDVGPINGWDGPDLLIQTDANTSFNAAAVPEPNTVLLFALGLLFLGFVGRSHRLGRS